MYARAGGDFAALPWAHLVPDAALLDWLDSDAAPPPGRAMVVGCGLGDDAEELARRGHRVTAFDLSRTAVARARERFPGSAVDYAVGDVTAPAPEWVGAFDLVVEIRTLQSVEPSVRPAAIAGVASMAAPGGLVFVRCSARDEGAPTGGRPWPLSRSDLAPFATAGLVEEDFLDRSDPMLRGRSFTVRYRRTSWRRTGSRPGG
jgi:SAM-dependent methyltransferase